MKTTVTTIILFLGLAFFACVDGISADLTQTDIAQVKSELQAFEKGQLTLEEVTELGGEAWGRKLVAYYETHTNDVTTKMELPVSRCYGAMGKYSEAVKCAQKYVNVFSNDWRGWRIIGSASLDMQNLNVAVDAYVNAVRLGDDGSCAPLAFTAMKTDRLDVVRDIVPRLLALKNSKPTRYVKPLDIVTALVLYSLRSNQGDIFVKALSGVGVGDILSRSDLEFLVRQGCEQFKGKDIDKIREKMEAASGNNSNSSNTNRPPP
ncbi:MAG: hypothetical protein PHY43_05255 [Verrucomicrobiales bacterium]|nr:hypothetical protein [Verrucomicrobiales bacterium]